MALWVRHRPAEDVAWSDWERVAVGMSPPIDYTFNYGHGFYEFATQALDFSGNREALPAAGDAATQFVP